MSSILDSLKSVKNPFTSSEDPQEEEGDGDTSTFFSGGVTKSLPKLSYKQRLIGFGICAGLAAAFAILGCALAKVNIPTFVIFFILGSIAGIISTFFLVSPIQQVKKMYDPSHASVMIIKICCVVTVILMIALAFCAVFWWKVGPISILFCIVEFVAIIIYAITLIPYATTFLSRGARTAFNNL